MNTNNSSVFNELRELLLYGIQHVRLLLNLANAEFKEWQVQQRHRLVWLGVLIGAVLFVTVFLNILAVSLLFDWTENFSLASLIMLLVYALVALVAYFAMRKGKDSGFLVQTKKEVNDDLVCLENQLRQLGKR